MRRVVALLLASAGALGVACGSIYGAESDEPSAPPPVEAGADVVSSPADAAVDVADTSAPPVDAGPPWRLYSNLDQFKTTWSDVALDTAWTGPNAPPPRGIKAVTQLTHQDRLLVWTDEGKFYVRSDGQWQPPQLTATVFPALNGLDFRGAYHQPDYPTPGVEELTFVDNPVAVLYTYSAAGAINLESPPVTISDEPPPFGAPKGTKKCRWVLRSWNLTVSGAGRLNEYSGYDGDPNVYQYDGTPKPSGKALFADSPLFKNKANNPPRDQIMSGWRDDSVAANYLIVR